MQLPVLVISIITMAAIAYFFIAAIRASNDEVTEAAASGDKRKRLIWAMVLFGAIITPLSLLKWPHAVSTAEDVITINATGAQWYWEIDRSEAIPLHRTVVFNVHTEDVTHGLGVVNSDGRLLFQTQAMPGYVNKVEYVFSKPGEYKVICMEFCGTAHHDMITEFTVAAQ